MNLSKEKLLTAAHLLFNSLGRIPLDAAADLMAAGFIVEELEEKWRQERDSE